MFPAGYSFDRNGYIAGAQIGYNQQVSNWLWGVEADISLTGLSGSQTLQTQCLVCFAPVLTSVTQNMDWFGTVRARLGVTNGPWLLYGTGGLAYGHVKYTYLNTNAPFGGPLTISAADSGVEFGWTAGAGVEYGFLSRWSARLERSPQ